MGNEETETRAESPEDTAKSCTEVLCGMIIVGCASHSRFHCVVLELGDASEAVGIA